MYIFHLENSGEEVVRECVRACICVWASARVRGRVLSYSKPPFWKIYFVGTQLVLTRMHCPKQSCLANWLFDWTDVFKNQFRHMHKQICAVWMMQRNLCWLSQGLVHQTIWNCQHVGLSPVKWILELCQRFVKLMCRQIACEPQTYGYPNSVLRAWLPKWSCCFTAYCMSCRTTDPR